MKRVLFLCTANPLGVGGGEFATRAYLKAVCDIAEGNVDLLITDDWKDDFRQYFCLKNLYIAPKRSRWQIILQYFNLIIDRFAQRAIDIIDDNKEEYSCVVANGSLLSGAISHYMKKIGLPLVAIYHNYEPEFYRDNFHGIRRFLFLPMVRILERRAYHNSDYNLFLSSQDMKRFAREYKTTRAKNSIIGVFEYNNHLSFISPTKKKKAMTFVITGSLNNAQGVDGILYFLDDLYNALPSDSRVIIAGKNPTDIVRERCLDYSNVELVSSPENIYDVISSGDVYICPTRLGGGVKLRVMDGLRLGLPVITHKCSARGYDLFWSSPSFEVFNTPKEFAASVERIVDLINNNSMDKMAVYNQYCTVFSYESGVGRVKCAIQELLND